ncbi:MASE3 domain-containing protein [Candidatus Lokiarchaeum ossiferum]|uniref:MASE3 domain-containing protein n=1 Tax=Candidatus Lokiarchaeum ossiferum TaxID=2951803 RepID=UPI00352EE6FE
MERRKVIKYGSFLFLTIVGFYLLSVYSFLVFHSLIEIFSIATGFSIFIFYWLSRNRIENPFYLFLGIGSFFIGMIDLLHVLSYKGINIFEGFDANLPTQFWIASRYLQLISIILALTIRKNKNHEVAVFLLYTVVTLIVSLAIFVFKIFPVCFIEGEGLTPFKKISEYIISLGLIGSIFLLRSRKEEFPQEIRWNLYLFFILTALSELAFTFYISVFGISNVIGHLFKLLANIILFRSILIIGLRNPYNIIFRELKQREKELEEKLKHIKTLSGLLPICSNCHKMRDDKGYWHRVDEYLHTHTDAELTHGICPECVKKLYGDLDF